MSDEEVSQYATPFVTSLFTMVNDPSNNEHICWNEAGDSIVIKYSFHFESKLLPKYFKTSKFCSFIRQLNVYGFHKVGDDSIPHGSAPASGHKEGDKENPTRILYFQHPNFKKGQSNLLKNIRRRNSSKRQVNGTGPEDEKPEVPASSAPTPTPSTPSSSSGSSNISTSTNISTPTTTTTSKPSTPQTTSPLSPDPVHYLMEEVGRLQHALQLVVGQLKVTKSRVDFLENELHQRSNQPQVPQQIYMQPQPIYQVPPTAYYISQPAMGNMNTMNSMSNMNNMSNMNSINNMNNMNNMNNINNMNNLNNIGSIPEATQLHYKKPNQANNGAYEIQNSSLQINLKHELVSSPISSFSTPSQTPPSHIPPTPPPVLISSSHLPNQAIEVVNVPHHDTSSEYSGEAYANTDYQYLSLEQLLSDINGNSALSTTQIPPYENISS
eukprot:TRINITY_DN2318_c0_g1_i1.p1 TRINITY_DN2318_c0_g1~~TRINITY_DN2318_c0_g1_i1.p1  ORF type:complete len:439 (-),score=93.72 TRINITY_DN2318_c0_g1_i1:51-1367(-)